LTLAGFAVESFFSNINTEILDMRILVLTLTLMMSFLSHSAFASESKDEKTVELSASLTKLGEGSFGEVSLYLGTDGQKYAIKKANRCQYNGSIKNEVDILRYLLGKRDEGDKQHIVTIIDGDFPEGVFMLEYWSGNLSESRKTLFENPDLRRGIRRQLKDAVEFIHKCGVTHCDLKPANILFNGTDRVVLCDFGLSHNFMNSWIKIERELRDYCYIVTRWYRPPHLCHKRAVEYLVAGGLVSAKDHLEKADWWSLGCVYAQMALGEPLFPGDSDESQIKTIIIKIKSDIEEILGEKGASGEEVSEILDLLKEGSLPKLLFEKLIKAVSARTITRKRETAQAAKAGGGATAAPPAAAEERLEIERLCLQLQQLDAQIRVLTVEQAESLLRLLKKNNVDAVGQIIPDLNEVFDVVGKDGKVIRSLTTLILTAQYGLTATIEALLGRGAEVDHAADDGTTALMWAAKVGHTETVQTLLDRGADVNKVHKGGLTALILAAKGGHTETVQTLLDSGADVNKVYKGGLTALILAAKGGHTAIIQTLLPRIDDPKQLESALEKAEKVEIKQAIQAKLAAEAKALLEKLEIPGYSDSNWYSNYKCWKLAVEDENKDLAVKQWEEAFPYKCVFCTQNKSCSPDYCGCNDLECGCWGCPGPEKDETSSSDSD
jgi:serine/threonine protein kinase